MFWKAMALLNLFTAGWFTYRETYWMVVISFGAFLIMLKEVKD